MSGNGGRRHGNAETLSSVESLGLGREQRRGLGPVLCRGGADAKSVVCAGARGIAGDVSPGCGRGSREAVASGRIGDAVSAFPDSR